MRILAKGIVDAFDVTVQCAHGTDAEETNQKWVADFTYIWTGEGWLLRLGQQRTVPAANGRQRHRL
jgi:transposase InsO family protein